MWVRISLKVLARKISLWYQHVLYKRNVKESRRLFILNRCARVIQRGLRRAMSGLRFASINIQRVARGRRGRVLAKYYKLQVRRILFSLFFNLVFSSFFLPNIFHPFLSLFISFCR